MSTIGLLTTGLWAGCFGLDVWTVVHNLPISGTSLLFSSGMCVFYSFKDSFYT